ncbi:MAG TPA: RodZ domain-containing protein [Nitrospirota bacterium]|nr:RodZ domain-containing protein [Nitrospirota bacterium]
MGTLGKYLQDARLARGIDLREAAQQTRISVQYLKALEAEDFSKLPGEVFVKGFLKNYGKFLQLDEPEILKRYAEIQQTRPPVASPAQAVPVAAAPVKEEEVHHVPSKFPLEPVLWAAGIAVILVLFFFSAFPRPQQHVKETPTGAPPPAAGFGELSSAPGTTSRPEKLYLEVVALENTWILIRTDSSPQKKAILNKGESLIWSADERFLLSYGSASDLKLVLNGKELTVDEPKNTVVRDMVITSSGIVSRKIQVQNPATSKTKRKPVPEVHSSQSVSAHVRQNQPQPASAQTKTPVEMPQKPVQ